MSKWTTRDGETIEVRDMSDQHLVNTIRYLRRSSAPFVMRKMLGVLSMLDQSDSDTVHMVAESELTNLMVDPMSALPSVYNEMVSEATSRGLSCD